jgi:hypothetical protein
MKRLLTIILVMLFAGSAVAESIDLSSMTADELEALQEQITIELKERNGVQSVTVPIGVWKVGEDIPFGHWTITTSENAMYGWSSVVYCEALDETGKKPNVTGGGFYFHSQIKLPGSEASVASEAIDIDMQNDGYVIVEYGDVVFAPYEGAPDLGF